jgi:hypothetical protein
VYEQFYERRFQSGEFLLIRSIALHRFTVYEPALI